jgi:hypothetical protein
MRPNAEVEIGWKLPLCNLPDTRHRPGGWLFGQAMPGPEMASWLQDYAARKDVLISSNTGSRGTGSRDTGSELNRV